MSYDTQSQDDIFDNLATDLLSANSDANPYSQATYTYALLFALSETTANNQEQSLSDVYDAAYVVDASGEDLTKKAQNLGVVREDAVRATGVVTFSRSSNASQDFVIPSGTIVETLAEDPVQFETTETATLSSGTSSVDANVVALEGGSDGNVGANAIQAMPSPPTGIDTVTNSDPTGDPSVNDTNGDPLRPGEDRETDAELRDRVLATDATTEGPNPDSVELAVENTTGVVGAHVNVNATGGTVNGINPYSAEVVVYGGDTQNVVDTLFETMSVTTLLRLQGGVNGTQNTANVYVSLIDQDVTVPITRPTELTFDLNIDVVHTGTYEGTNAVKDTIVEYVGGTDTGGTTVDGLIFGEDVMVNEIENRVEDLTGVDYANVTLVDTNNDSTDDTTTDSDGVPVLAVGNNEIPRVDASNITVSETAR